MTDLNIDVNIVNEEVGVIFGRHGKTKFKALVKNKQNYLHTDSIQGDIEILTDKSGFDELLIKENTFFINTESFNSDNLHGTMIFTEFGIMYSRSNLATVKAIRGVHQNVYQYEVQLGTNGPMKIGWATKDCVFSNHAVVGDTSNSYCFDGYFLKKLNQSSSLPYGKKWRVGNIIGCVIDFPNTTIEYFNNGQSLGKAFEQFNRDEKTYFPALTLSNEENVFVNLGERPFKFPIIGSVPIVANPTVLTDYFKRLEKNIISLIDNHIKLQSKTKNNEKQSNKIIVNNIIRNVIFQQFVILLKIPYIIDGCFIPFLYSLIKKNDEKLIVFLEFMWENVLELEMVSIMEHLMFCLSCEFKCIWRSKFDTSHQIMVLKLLNAICQESNTRKQMIVNILFGKIKFAHFLHIISPSDDMFKQMIPVVCWNIESLDLNEELKENLTKNFPLDYKRCKSAHINACNTIKHLVSELEKLQLLFLKTLLNDKDQSVTKVSSRILFCRRFQSFVQENMIYWRNDPMLRLPGPVLLSTFFRLSCLLRELYKEEIAEDKDVKIQPNIFYLENCNYFGIERIGGSFSHLKSKYHKIIKTKFDHPIDNQTHEQNDSDSSDVDIEITEMNSPAGLITVLTRLIGNADDRNANTYSTEMVLNRIFSFDHLPTEKSHVLSAILNNTICLYHTVGHRQLTEYISFKDRLSTLALNYSIIDYKLRTSSENKDDLKQTLKELEEKIGISSRHVAWLMSMTFINTNESILEWILTVISNTIKHCSENEGELFRFVPEFYIDNILGIVVILPDYKNETQQFENIVTDRTWLAVLIGEVLLQHFGDGRIVHPKSKESILQGIILYLTNPNSIKILQTVPETSRLHAIESILKSTERSMWTKINTILMLIWYGSGFAFRYTRPPYLENHQISTRSTIEEIVFTNMGTERPPAYVLQNDLRSVVTNDRESASNFINNSLNYLNWAFSEFISLFQEIKDIHGNDDSTISPEEITKLKTCGKSFIHTVTLLRVIEMMINFNRDLIINQEGSLGRVFQLLCQIFNRINSSTSTFTHIFLSNLPYVEFVHKFTVTVATLGVLLSILESEIDEKEKNLDDDSNTLSSIPDITNLLISEPNFNLSSLEFINLPETENSEPFSLNSHKKYITEEELKKVSDMYQHLDWFMKRHNSMASSINDDDLCMICYSNRCNVTLIPCEHQCCKLCINHHILYSHVCFYCKRRIELVVDANDSSTILHHFGSEPPGL